MLARILNSREKYLTFFAEIGIWKILYSLSLAEKRVHLISVNGNYKHLKLNINAELKINKIWKSKKIFFVSWTVSWYLNLQSIIHMSAVIVHIVLIYSRELQYPILIFLHIINLAAKLSFRYCQASNIIL